MYTKEEEIYDSNSCNYAITAGLLCPIEYNCDCRRVEQELEKLKGENNMNDYYPGPDGTMPSFPPKNVVSSLREKLDSNVCEKCGEVGYHAPPIPGDPYGCEPDKDNPFIENCRKLSTWSPECKHPDITLLYDHKGRLVCGDCDAILAEGDPIIETAVSLEQYWENNQDAFKEGDFSEMFPMNSRYLKGEEYITWSYDNTETHHFVVTCHEIDPLLISAANVAQNILRLKDGTMIRGIDFTVEPTTRGGCDPVNPTKGYKLESHDDHWDVIEGDAIVNTGTCSWVKVESELDVTIGKYFDKSLSLI